MPQHTDHEDYSQRTKLAVAAAAATGTTMGLDVSTPKVLYDAFSVVVHLAPSPVVARIPTVFPPWQEDVLEQTAAKQRAELHVAAWLEQRGVPVVPPSQYLPPEPVQHDGFSMTFWELVEHDKSSEPDYVAGHGATAGLHAHLAQYPGQLDFLTPVEFIGPALKHLETHADLVDPADLDRAQEEWAILESYFGSRAAFNAKFPETPLQAIHGDAPSFNRIPTPASTLFADFEELTLGPVEWDLMLAGDEGVAAYNDAARERGIRQLDPMLLQGMEAVGRLRALACLSLAPQLPMLRDGLTGMIADWRERPIAAGLT